MAATATENVLDARTRAFYVAVLDALAKDHAPFLIGGAYAFERYTSIQRNTKDLDVFVRKADASATLDLLAREGYRTEMTFPHWLGKAYGEDHFIDVIFGSGNGICLVDDDWFAHAVADEVLGRPVLLCPPEEMIWSKAFIQERERFDGADVVHLIRARGPTLDWDRVLARFDDNWPVLLSHLIMFRYIYPGHAAAVPERVFALLLDRCREALPVDPEDAHACRGTLLSREQYLADIKAWGYRDPRLRPDGPMTREQVRTWTNAIGT